MNYKYILSLLLLLTNVATLSAQNIQNPVLPNVADAGVIKHNGKYYIGGVFTDGDFYVSDDLVNWTGPIHVFDMNNEWTAGTGAGNDQIHANDMIYLNGKFHLYWSVNYWGRDKHIVHIAHAESDSILGPYIEPVKETWMDNRIDPHIFRDDNGKLYMYMVRFTDGNTIWVRPMKDPRTFSGHPICLFASLPGTWETMDSRVAEGPWVIKYRSKYYMMYNANHTGTDWGNYQLGVAEADSPVAFNNGNKYPYPLFKSNQIMLEEKYADILTIGKTYNPYFKYSTSAPQGNWMKPDYNDDAWQQGIGGFASKEIKGSTTRYRGTEWNTPAIYLRKTFNADETTGNLALRVTHNGDTKVYLNEKLIYDKNGADYYIYNLTEKDKSTLKNGTNILAVESKQGRKNYINVSLFDIKNDTADDILFSPGQPNIVRGPNGFEWWLVYMANKNNERRSQYINRIYFHNKTMHADGITVASTKGYYPEPTKPTYSNTGELTLSEKKQWFITENIPAATSYLFETGIKTNSNAGIIAWWKDKNNWIKIGLDASANQWYVQKCLGSKVSTETYPLPENFRFGVYHKLSIERNAGNFHIKLDNLTIPVFNELKTTITEPGLPGLFTEDGNTNFDGIVYTNGWDEFDQNIAFWGNSLNGEKQQGEYTVENHGIATSENIFKAFKGDLLSQYEFSVQINNESGKGQTGAYPVYINKNNYIKTVFDYDKQQLMLTKVENGKTVTSDSYSLEDWQTHYADIKYTDFIEKGYTFDTPVWINGIQLNRLAHGQHNVFIDNMFDKLSGEYRMNGKWYPLPVSKIETAINPMYNEAVFSNQVKTDALRFTNSNAEDESPYIYKIRVKEVFKTSYNLRCVKKSNRLLIFIDGKLIAETDASELPAQVGLYSENAVSSFNGITRYHIP